MNRGAWFAALLWMGASAQAQDAEALEAPAVPVVQPQPEAVPQPPPESTFVAPAPQVLPPARSPRIIGFGSALGFGGAAAQTSSFSSTGGILFAPALELPTIEALFFFSDYVSLDVSIPILNIAVVSAVLRGIVWQTSAYLDFSFGDEIRFICGPGIGFSVVSFSGETTATLRIPALLGVEFFAVEHLMGLRLMTRPFVDVAFLSTGVVAGGGALLEFATNFYAN